jgi:uncharacterized membrane protein
MPEHYHYAIASGIEGDQSIVYLTCSEHVTPDEFTALVKEAARDAYYYQKEANGYAWIQDYDAALELCARDKRFSILKVEAEVFIGAYGDDTLRFAGIDPDEED